MAVFGAPTAHEDDAERAVRAAARMQAVVRRLVEAESGGGQRLGLRVGLNTGEVVAGRAGAAELHGHRRHRQHRRPAVGRGRASARCSPAGRRRSRRWRRPPGARCRRLRLQRQARAGAGVRAGRDAARAAEPARAGRRGAVPRPRRRVRDARRAAAGRRRRRSGRGPSSSPGRRGSARPGWRRSWRTSPASCPGRGCCGAAARRTASGATSPPSPTWSAPPAASARATTPATARARVAAHRGPAGAGTVRCRPASPSGWSRCSALEDLPGAGQPRRDAGRAGRAATRCGRPWPRCSPRLAARRPAAARAGGRALGHPDDAGRPGRHRPRRCAGEVLLLALGRPDVLEVRAAGSGPDAPPWWQTMERAEVLVLPRSARRRASGCCRPTSARRRPWTSGCATRSCSGRRATRSSWPSCCTCSSTGACCGAASRLGARQRAGVGRRRAAVHAAGRRAGRARGADRRPRRRCQGRAARRERAGPDRDARRRSRRSAGPRGTASRRSSARRSPPWSTGGCSSRSATRPRARAAAVRAHAGPRRRVRRADQGRAGPAARGRRRARAAQRRSAAARRTCSPPTTASGRSGWRPRWGCRPTTRPGRPRPLAFTALVRLGQAALGRDDSGGAERALARALALAGPGPGDAAARGRRGRGPGRSGPRALASCTGWTRPRPSSPPRSPARADRRAPVRAAALAVLGDVRRKRGDAAGARAALVAAHTAARRRGQRPARRARRCASWACSTTSTASCAAPRSGSGRRTTWRERVGDLRGAGWALQHLAWSATTRGDYALADRGAGAGGRRVRRARGQRRAVVGGRHRGLRPAAAGPAAPRPASWPARCCRSARQLGERWGVAALLVIDALAAAELGEVELAAAEAERARAGFERGRRRLGAGARADGLRASRPAAPVRPGPGRRAVRRGGPAGRGASTRSSPGSRWSPPGTPSSTGATSTAPSGPGAGPPALHARLDLEPHAALGAQVLLAQVQRRRGHPEQALATLDAALRRRWPARRCCSRCARRCRTGPARCSTSAAARRRCRRRGPRSRSAARTSGRT